jgi:hypothetical protein
MKLLGVQCSPVPAGMALVMNRGGDWAHPVSCSLGGKTAVA